MSLSQDISGIVDEATPEGSIFDDALEAGTAPESGEQTASATHPKAQGADTTIQPSGVAPEDAPVEPFSFGGREWASREAAENDWKSWEGRIQSEQSKVRDYEARINEYWDYVQAVSRENDEFRAKSTAETEKTATPAAPTVDFDQIGRIMEIARNQGMDPMAVGMKAYAAQAEKVYEHKLSERLAAVEGPIQDIQNASAEKTADREMFLWAQGLKDSTGSPAFPDLQPSSLNEDLVVNVHRVWKQLSREFGAKYAYSAPGFDYAYRLAQDMTPARAITDAPAAGMPPQDMARDASGRFTSGASAAAASSDLTGNQPNPTRARQVKSPTQEMLEELSAIQPLKIGSTELGFFE